MKNDEFILFLYYFLHEIKTFHKMTPRQTYFPSQEIDKLSALGYYNFVSHSHFHFNDERLRCSSRRIHSFSNCKSLDLFPNGCAAHSHFDICKRKYCVYAAHSDPEKGEGDLCIHCIVYEHHINSYNWNK